MREGGGTSDPDTEELMKEQGLQGRGQLRRNRLLRGRGLWGQTKINVTNGAADAN